MLLILNIGFKLILQQSWNPQIPFKRIHPEGRELDLKDRFPETYL